jgi:competence protein ComEC
VIRSGVERWRAVWRRRASASAPAGAAARRAVRRAALLAAALCLGSELGAQELELSFIDVGQADAALLVTPEGRTMLVDAGRNARNVLALLRQRGVDTLDLVVVSHIHEDHMGGIPALLAAVPVRNFMDNGTPRARTAGRYLNAVVASGARYLEAAARNISLGSVRVRVLPPPDERLRLRDNDQNNRSVGLLIEYGEFRALLTGDSETPLLSYWLAHDSIPPVTLVKAAHHGSDNGTTPEWVARTAPRIVTISVGRNGYGHPGAGAVSAWCQAEATVLRTDRNGTITVRADSSGAFTVTASRSPKGGPPANSCGVTR